MRIGSERAEQLRNFFVVPRDQNILTVRPTFYFVDEIHKLSVFKPIIYRETKLLGCRFNSESRAMTIVSIFCRKDVIELQRSPIDCKICEIACTSVSTCVARRRQAMANIRLLGVADNQNDRVF